MVQAVAVAAGPATDTDDPRLRAFCSPAVPDLFHAVAHHHEIWKHDPYDVPSIHAEARTVFQRLLNQATLPPGLPAGRVLLLRGESGSGKTHLMRAFRNHVHQAGIGYCGYLQMTSAAGNYPRYILANLVDSLDHPYYERDRETSGLMRLANALAETPHAILPRELQQLREAHIDDTALAKVVREMADNVLMDDRFSDLDLDLVRALLYLQRNNARIKKRVLAYVRCEDLSDHDRQVLGGLVPRKHDEDPLRMIENLARLMWRLQGAALVICLDQLEEMHETAGNGERFRRAMTAVCALADRAPASLWVIACLDDYYTLLRDQLTRPLVDRIERDPVPMTLTSSRSLVEVRELVGRRLASFYETQEVPDGDEVPTFPYSDAALERLAGMRTRDVLAWCGEHREKCVRAGQWKPLDNEAPPQPLAKPLPAPTPPPGLNLAQAWNDFQTSFPASVPEDEAALAALLAQAITACSGETTTGHWFSAEPAQRLIQVEIHGADNTLQRLVAGVCNRGTQGGGLGKQIKEVQDRAGDLPAAIIRSTDFPNNPKAEVTKQIGKLVARGGKRVVIEDSEWRAMLAAEEFHKQHEQAPEFQEWLRKEKPLTRLKSLRTLLGLDQLTAPAAAAAPPPVPAPAPAESKPQDRTAIRLGQSEGRQPTPVTVSAQDLTAHAAFLGGSGSGKTTLALNLIEQLLLSGVPALLLDRKGDLCGYARPEAGAAAAGEELLRRRTLFRQRVDVAVYTPGNPSGRPLSIPLVPDGIDQLAGWEREHLAGYAAFALGGMMSYKDRGQDASRLAILKQAIALLTSTGGPPLTLDEVINLISGPDPALLAAIGQLDAKLCRRLVDDLETLRLTKDRLLAREGDGLDTERLLGLGAHAVPGKTRLSIVSTKFLGDNAMVEFWVAQLLLELTRWISKHPSAGLQAVLLFDEADMYLPALRKPPTKEPMENLLKRARSAGIGVLLASQSPGDFDYRCRDNVRTWFLGRITQKTSVDKMKLLLSDCRTDVGAKLPGQEPGQFMMVCDGNVAAFRADRSLLATEQLSEDDILHAARAGKA